MGWCPSPVYTGHIQTTYPTAAELPPTTVRLRCGRPTASILFSVLHFSSVYDPWNHLSCFQISLLAFLLTFCVSSYVFGAERLIK